MISTGREWLHRVGSGPWAVPHPRALVFKSYAIREKAHPLNCYWTTLFKRRDGVHIRDYSIEIGLGHAAEPHLAGHRSLKRTSVARYALSERPLDLRIGPFADP